MYLLQKFDISILLFIKYNMYGIIMDKVMVILSYLGNAGIIWIMIAAILISNKKHRKIGLMALAALILSAILGDEILKNIFKRLRPADTMPTMNLLIERPLSYSFPSGHSMSSFAVAGVLVKYFKKYVIEIISLASLIAFSRVYLYVHYPTDVLVGAILGLVCSALVIYIFDNIKNNSKASI
ncbi:phosphatase PAP2 family protein [Clostridium estertheticum]|nr:phosphatase PAP2 family protein [Clostridium estertheticum]MBW9153142.1 phosphatase PAP2 family protein [Clostridium estertheticum]WLC86297.1 phosphatase PAP2 family protein [Clostridium estertheticum]